MQNSIDLMSIPKYITLFDIRGCVISWKYILHNRMIYEIQGVDISDHILYRNSYITNHG